MSTLAKRLMVVTSLNSLACVGATVGYGVSYQAGVSLAEFRSQLEASCVSSYTDEL